MNLFSFKKCLKILLRYQWYLHWKEECLLFHFISVNNPFRNLLWVCSSGKISHFHCKMTCPSLYCTSLNWYKIKKREREREGIKTEAQLSVIHDMIDTLSKLIFIHWLMWMGFFVVGWREGKARGCKIVYHIIMGVRVCILYVLHY